MVTPDQAWAARQDDLKSNPEIGRIQKVTAGGFGGIAIAPKGWRDAATLTDVERKALNRDFLRCKLSPQMDSVEHGVRKGEGLNRNDRGTFTPEDAQYFADHLPEREIWLDGKAYTAAPQAKSSAR